MNTKINKIICAICVICGLTSCGDMLETVPQGIFTAEQLKNASDDALDGLMASAYAGLEAHFIGNNEAFAGPSTNWIFDVRSDDAYKGGGGTGMEENIHLLEVSEIHADNVSGLDKWRNNYWAIVRVHKAMKAIQDATADGMFVQKVEELIEDGKVVGVTVTYTTGKVVTFQISGAGAEINLAAIKNASGVLCWALNGEILKDAQGKDLAVGQTPSFSIENGVLYMTVDGKKTEIGPMGGGLGDAIFKDIKVTANAVVLTMDDGSTIEIPFAKAFKLVIAEDHGISCTDLICIFHLCLYASAH